MVFCGTESDDKWPGHEVDARIHLTPPCAWRRVAVSRKLHGVSVAMESPRVAGALRVELEHAGEATTSDGSTAV
jgi:hypothetical protein